MLLPLVLSGVKVMDVRVMAGCSAPWAEGFCGVVKRGHQVRERGAAAVELCSPAALLL